MKGKRIIVALSAGVLALLSLLPASAASHAHDSRVGSHGMVVYTDGTALFAHHLPLYHAPHDAQLVYEIETQHKAKIIERLKASQSQTEQNPIVAVTVIPEVFDLNLLIQGQPLTISAQWFTGHFERGGIPWFEDTQLTFTQALYVRLINTVDVDDSASFSIEFEQVNASDSAALVIHKIATKPSFDAVLRVGGCKQDVPRTIQASQPVMSSDSIWEAFTDCSVRQLVYYETTDFAHH